MKNKEIIQSYKMSIARYDANVYHERILTKIIEQLQRFIAGTKNASNSKPIVFDNHVVVSFSISDFKDENGNIQYTRIIEAVRDLSNKSFEYKYTDERNKKHWVKYNFLNSTNMIFEDGMITVELNKGFLNCVFDFSDGFRKYEYIYPFRLSSYYAIRMYKLISKCKNPISYSLSDFKKMLSINTLRSYNNQGNLVNLMKRISEELISVGAPYTFECEISFKDEKITIIPMKNAYGNIDEDINRRNSEVIKARRDIGEDVFDLLREGGFTRTVIAHNRAMIEYLRMKIGIDILNKINELIDKYKGNPRFKTLIINKLRKLEKSERGKEESAKSR